MYSESNLFNSVLRHSSKKCEDRKVVRIFQAKYSNEKVLKLKKIKETPVGLVLLP